MQPNLSTIILNISSLFVAILPSVIFFITLANIPKETLSNPIRKRVAFLAVAVIFILWIFMLFATVDQWFFIPLVIIWIIVLLFFLPLFEKSKGMVVEKSLRGTAKQINWKMLFNSIKYVLIRCWSKYKNKLAESDSKTKTSIQKSWSLYILIAISIIILLLITADSSGMSEAQRQHVFYIISWHNSNAVVLRQYGNTLICAPFQYPNIISQAYFVVLLDETPRTILVPIDIGYQNGFNN
jgi:hypothetical protein